MPIDTLATILTTPRSLSFNTIGGFNTNGCEAIAAVLKDTQITALRCARATPLILSVNAC